MQELQLQRPESSPPEVAASETLLGVSEDGESLNLDRQRPASGGSVSSSPAQDQEPSRPSAATMAQVTGPLARLLVSTVDTLAYTPAGRTPRRNTITRHWACLCLCL